MAATQGPYHHTVHQMRIMLNGNLLIKPVSYDMIERRIVLNHEIPYDPLVLGVSTREDPFVIRSSGYEVLTTIVKYGFLIP